MVGFQSTGFVRRENMIAIKMQNVSKGGSMIMNACVTLVLWTKV